MVQALMVAALLQEQAVMALPFHLLAGLELKKASIFSVDLAAVVDQ